MADSLKKTLNRVYGYPYKPNNKLPILPPVGVNLETVENLKLCIEAGRALSRLDGQTSTTFRYFANALNVVKLFSVPEAVASSAVENIVTTVAEAIQAKAIPTYRKFRGGFEHT